jgi:diguanylate cyclase (GGDEF)-like protein/PAS domain S-box-containing protein
MHAIGPPMLRTPQFRVGNWIALAGLMPALAGIAWLLYQAIVEGHELSAVEDIALDLLIGLVVFVALGWLMLRHQLRGREQYQSEIDAGKRTLDTAVSHMSQGLVMFDQAQRIVLVNRRYIQMYRVSAAVVKPGLMFRDLLIHRRETGSFLGDVDNYCTIMAETLAAGKTSVLVAETSGGRIVRIVNEPLASGGWVATHEDITERHRAEEQVSRQKLQLDTALNNMSQGLNMFDANGHLVLCNQRYLSMYRLSRDIAKPGCTVEDLVNARIASGTFFAADPQRYIAELLEGMRKREASSTTMALTDGRTIAVNSEPTPDGSGWVVTHEDVTERQQLLELRERSEKLVGEQKRQLDIALNNMTHGLCMFDPEGRIVLFNRRYSEMMGESAAYLSGLSLLDLFKRRKANGTLRGDPDRIFADIMASIRQGKPTVREMVRVDGIVLRVVDQPLEGGGWVATHEDVSEQRRTERDRDRNRAFLDLIIDNVPSAIFVKNAVDRRYVLVNRAAERFWGMQRQAMIGKTASDVFPEAEARRIEARENELLQSGETLLDEREILTPNDGVRSIFSRRLTIRDKNDAEYLLGVVDDVTERKAADARIAQLAHYDPLTGLPNRTLFREQLEKELAFVRRGAQLAVLYLDLDHFKGINDTLGHPAGDELLRVVAQRLRGCLRECDLIARLGGDEFAIVQTALEDPKDTETLARRLREAVTGASYDLHGHQTTTDVSIGIALSPGDGTEMDELVKHADLALYGAKAEGRANYRYFEPEMNARMKRRRGLEIDLRSALQKDEFELLYQPLINLQSNTITGCEALLRWHHPERGLVAPAEFIPVAEETGLIGAIGEWVLRRACKEAMTWPSHVSVAVNVSPVQFRNPTLCLTVVSSLGASGLPAGRLELEVTESVLMQNNDATLATLHQIRDLGVRIAMDDFGTGYSSLSYLRSFPFDKIKIDQSFISDMSKGEDAVAIVQAIINLAGSLRMSTTAEGVETVEQHRLLQAAGCHEMQGYLFSRPISARQIAELFAAAEGPTKVA